MYLGPAAAFLALDVRFAQNLSAQQVETAAGRLEKAIRAKPPEFKRLFVEAESFAPEQRTGWRNKQGAN